MSNSLRPVGLSGTVSDLARQVARGEAPVATRIEALIHRYLGSCEGDALAPSLVPAAEPQTNLGEAQLMMSEVTYAIL